MKIWLTEIKALDPETGIMKVWAGPNITAPNHDAAVDYCQTNGLGYCDVVGQLVAEVDYNTGVRIDFDNLN